ncbi:hypothetical protein ACAG39_09545 [Caldicellulosiruptoraceae bacterium PP1]
MHRKVSIERNKVKWGILFSLPWLIGLLLFYIYPILSSFIFSFFDYNGIDIKSFTGFKNYLSAFNDDLFIISVKNTLFYTIIAVPLNLILGVLIAVLLNSIIKFIGVFRAIFFIPTLVPTVAIALIWQWSFNNRFDYINYLLNNIGIVAPAWFESEMWSKPAIITICLFQLLNLWNDFTGPLIYLQEESKYTLQLALQQFKSTYMTSWPHLMAAAVLVSLPIIIIFVISQNYFVKGKTFSGIKG